MIIFFIVIIVLYYSAADGILSMFEEFDFGNHQNAQLSAKKSHIDDHERILANFFFAICLYFSLDNLFSFVHF